MTVNTSSSSKIQEPVFSLPKIDQISAIMIKCKVSINPLHPMDYPIYVDTISMEYSIMYFKGFLGSKFNKIILFQDKKIIFLFLNQNICCGYSKNRLIETVLLSTQNIW